MENYLIAINSVRILSELWCTIVYRISRLKYRKLLYVMYHHLSPKTFSLGQEPPSHPRLHQSNLQLAWEGSTVDEIKVKLGKHLRQKPALRHRILIEALTEAGAGIFVCLSTLHCIIFNVMKWWWWLKQNHWSCSWIRNCGRTKKICLHLMVSYCIRMCPHAFKMCLYVKSK